MWPLKPVVSACLLLTLSAPTLALAYSPSQYESVISGDEAQVDRVREQEISQLKIVLGRRFAESRKPDILLRLAELYIEKYRFYFLKENQIHQQQFKRGLRPKRVDTSRSKSYLRQSTSALLAILKSRVPYGKLDQVYYFLGYNAGELDNRKEAARYFDVVVSRYPGSPYAAEAYRNIAETAFDQGQYQRAVDMYERAARFTKIQSYPRTLYKLAWSYFKTRRKADALATMKKAVELSGGEEKFLALRDEALNDLVMFYSEAGRYKEAHDYFERVSGGAEIYIRALSRLANAYERKGSYKLAINLNESLINEYGDKQPELVYDILGRNVELYKKLNDGAGEERALNRLVDYFAKYSSDISKGDDSQATLARAKNYLRGRATQVHKEAQKHKSSKLYGRSADLYALYIKAFLGKSSDEKIARELSEIRTYRADALLAAGREQDGMIELDRVFRETGENKNRREAGTTLLNILIKKIDAAKGKASSDVEKSFLSAAEKFEDLFPEDKLVAELRYKKARLIAAKADSGGSKKEAAMLPKDARRALEELVDKYPGRGEAVEAARDLVADAVRRNDADEASKRAQVYLANPALMAADKRNELKPYLKSILNRQSFSDVQEIERDKDYAKAAAEYERVAAQSEGDGEVVSKAFNNAAVNYERAGKPEEAARIYFMMLSRFKKNQAPKDELKRLASQYLWNSRFGDSVKLYARLASMPIYSNEERYSFLKSAFSLSWGLGDLAAAYVHGTTIAREHCSKKYDDRCDELAFDLAELLLEAKRNQEALAHLKSYLNRKGHSGRKAEASFMVANLYRQQLLDPRKARVYYEQAAQAVASKGKKKSGSVRERNFAAHAAFLLVEPHFASFQSLKLELPETKLKAVTRKKLDALEGLVTRYLAVVNYGDGEWGIAALERLHDAFSGFASELENSPVPPRIPEAQIGQYKQGLRQVSEPMNARAMEYLRQGYQVGLNLEVTTPTYVALTQRLYRRSPNEYPAAHYAMVAEPGSKESVLRLIGAVPEDAVAARKQISAKLNQNPKASDTWVEFGNLELGGGRNKLARLLYEQALSLNPKSAAAQGNLSAVLFFEQHTIEAAQGYSKAVERAEFNKDLKLNLAKVLLAFHHFRPALEALRPLAGRFPEDQEIKEALAVALLGTAQLSQAGTKLEEIDAKGSQRFSLWYNWCVWALLAGEKKHKEQALEILNERKAGLGALEKSQVELVLSAKKGDR